MCGPHSALGLDQVERDHWPYLRERLRRPGTSMGLMRAVLGGDTEVAVVVATTPAGVSSLFENLSLYARKLWVRH